MSLSLTDTIAAIASPPGPALRGIIRVSGETVHQVVASIFQPADASEPWLAAGQARRFEGHLNVPALHVPVSAALMYWPDHRSYTGQPMAEFHLTGSEPVLDATLECVLAGDVRPANRGEFTMRAFLAGRMDLVQAEAVLGVIDATDHEELATALQQLGGGITQVLTVLRNDLLSLLGDLEAGLDFVEEDIEFISSDQIVDRLNQAQMQLQSLLSASDDRLRSGVRRRIVLAGLPNAGKSSLFNQLLQRDQAIVSPVAGTTRDYVSGLLNVDGREVEVIDTAGIEAAADLIMKQAQSLQSDQLQTSDLVLWCRAADLSEDQCRADTRHRQRLATMNRQTIDVRTRIDTIHPDAESYDPAHIAVSSVTGEGLDGLRNLIARRLQDDRNSRSELVGATAARCRDSLRRTQAALSAAEEAARGQLGDEVTAMELRDALHQIATILGEVYTDDILDHIFSNFCIGK